MNKGGKQTRLKLFDELAIDLSRNVLGKHEVVWCPLCLNEFGREAAESGVLTEEHVIPKSTTNHEVTLTCKSCNDKAGHQIDYQIGRKIKHDLAVKSGKSLKGKLKWEGGGTPADVTFKKNGDIHLDLQRATPHVTKSLIEKLAAHATGERPMRLRLVSPYRMEKYAAALVKSAYLGLFVDRGYGYILLPALETIRRAILEDGGDRERLAEIVVACNLNACADLPQPPDRFTFETHGVGTVPVSLSYVNLRNLSGGALVVLPPQLSLNTGSLDGLARAAKVFKERITFEVEMTSGGKMMITFDPKS